MAVTVCSAYNPNKHARSNSEAFRFGQLWPLRPVMAITASVQPELDFPHPVRFRIFAKKARITLCKTDPDPIWMAWSGFGQTHLVQKQAGVEESSGPVSSRTQPEYYQLSIFRLGCVLLLTARIILCKTNPERIRFGLHVYVRLRPNGSGPEASRCATITRSTSGQQFRADRIRHVYWDVLSATFGILRSGSYFLTATFWLLRSDNYVVIHVHCRYYVLCVSATF